MVEKGSILPEAPFVNTLIPVLLSEPTHLPNAMPLPPRRWVLALRVGLEGHSDPAGTQSRCKAVIANTLANHRTQNNEMFRQEET